MLPFVSLLTAGILLGARNAGLAALPCWHDAAILAPVLQFTQPLYTVPCSFAALQMLRTSVIVLLHDTDILRSGPHGARGSWRA